MSRIIAMVYINRIHCYDLKWGVILFLTSELANKAEIYILSARDTTRASVPGRGIMGNNVRVYKTMYNTWLSSRLQNQPRSLARLIFPFTVRNVGHQRRSVQLD